MAKAITFKPIFHREVPGHAGPVWHLVGDPNETKAQAEQRRLIAEGCVVVQPAGQPGTGFIPAEEQARDIQFVAGMTVGLGAVWAVIWAVVAVAHKVPAYAALLALAVIPLTLAVGLYDFGVSPAQRSDANPEKPNRK